MRPELKKLTSRTGFFNDPTLEPMNSRHGSEDIISDMSYYNRLRRGLADLYPKEDDARRLGRDANVDIAQVDFRGGALTFWNNLIEQANYEKKLQELLKQIIADNPPLDIIDIINIFAEEVKSGSFDRNPDRYKLNFATSMLDQQRRITEGMRPHDLDFLVYRQSGTGQDFGTLGRHWRRWVLKSSRRSVAQSQPSVLAVLEMFVFSVVLLAAIQSGWGQRSFIFSLALSAIAIAPLSLLKTRRSTIIGLILYRRIIVMNKHIEKWRDDKNVSKFKKELRMYSCFLFFLFAIPILMVIIRVISVLFALIAQPIETAFTIPKNWFRTVFVLDFCYLPEPVPDLENSDAPKMYSAREQFHNMSSHTKKRFSDRSIVFKLVYQSGWIAQSVLLYAPAYITRVALKSSWLIWLPIIYAASISSPTRMQVRERIEYILTSPIELTIRKIALFHALFILLQLLFSGAMIKDISKFPSFSDSSFALIWQFLQHGLQWSSLVELTPQKEYVIRLWGIPSVVNIFITLMLWNIAKSELRRERVGKKIVTGKFFLFSLLFVRGSIGIILVIKAVYHFLIQLPWPVAVRIMF